MFCKRERREGLTSRCQVKSSRRGGLSAGDQALCEFYTPGTHVWNREENTGYIFAQIILKHGVNSTTFCVDVTSTVC